MSEWIRSRIRIIPDYPKPGILFQDVTTLLKDATGFRKAVDELVQPFAGAGITRVAGIEARGFILGGAVAHQLSVGFVPVRKAGKLPGPTIAERYELEYGADALEIHSDAVQPGDQVLVVDDVLATGGTAGAAIALLRRKQAHVVGGAFLIDLVHLGGNERLTGLGVPVHALASSTNADDPVF
ncbi:MAG: adenine phosphoribosyltransferase [Alphaproteobacteria bacterium]|nr:MAG: adenine phosphoribosyltransferase [Alphaproteobacteria bacterium]